MGFDIKDAQEAFEEAENGWSETYSAAKEDLAFAEGDCQWRQEDIKSREAMNRPSLTINLIPQFVHQVVNDIRIKQPSIDVAPVGDGADKETAKIIKGLIRNIEYTSSASEAYINALNYAVRGGIGFFRLDHDFQDVDTFNQQIFIRKVVNPFSVYLDPASIDVDGADAMYGFAMEELSQKAFERKYKDFDPINFSKSSGDSKCVSIAEYFKIDETQRKMALLESGEIVDFKQGMDGVKTVRTVSTKSVKRYKLSGSDILEETTFPGVYIPLVPVYGEEIWIDGKRRIKSLTRDMKDPQRMHNYWASLETQILMMQPIAPVMAAVGQTEDFADEWNNPGSSMVLHYKPTDAMGNNVGAPQRLSPPSIPTGIINARQSSADDMKASVGMYNDSLGRASNATSGVAINNRKVEGEVATIHFGDNLNKSIAHGGRIAVSMIPVVYDTSRIVRIMGEEDDSQEVGINGEIAEGQKQAFDLTAGQYDVRVTTGSSFTTKRQEAVQHLQTLIQADPSIVQIAGDILVKNMDFPGADALSERLRKMVPPNLLSEKEASAAQSIAQDPEKQQMMETLQQGAQEVAQLQEQVKQLETALKDKKEIDSAGIQIDIAKLELDKQKIDNDRLKIEIEQFKAQSDVSLREKELVLNASSSNNDCETEVKNPSQNKESGEEEMGLDVNELEALLTLRRNKMAQEEQARFQEQERLNEQEAMKQQKEEMEMIQKQALLDSILSVKDSVNALVGAVSAPKTVLRDQSGKVVGVQ